ncbi:hypothetical protein ACJMK2_020979 [Sinanodonta woodiana]|uniref:Uncharacterized protein n=1 Tax=Sinanodonta woodiana TaxID=1069815 RepID=A0ABD3U0U1_SINWO
MIETLDFDALKTLLKEMEPVKLAVDNPSRDGVMLMSSERILEFMFNKLSNRNDDLSTKLIENLKCCVEERLNKEVMRFICCPLKQHTKFRRKSGISSIWRQGGRRCRRTVV